MNICTICCAIWVLQNKRKCQYILMFFIYYEWLSWSGLVIIQSSSVSTLTIFKMSWLWVDSVKVNQYLTDQLPHFLIISEPVLLLALPNRFSFYGRYVIMCQGTVSHSNKYHICDSLFIYSFNCVVLTKQFKLVQLTQQKINSLTHWGPVTHIYQ